MKYEKIKELSKLFESNKENCVSIPALRSALKLITDSIYEIFLKTKNLKELQSTIAKISSKTLCDLEKSTESEKILFNFYHSNKKFYLANFKKFFQEMDEDSFEKNFMRLIGGIVTSHLNSIFLKLGHERRKLAMAEITAFFAHNQEAGEAEQAASRINILGKDKAEDKANSFSANILK